MLVAEESVVKIVVKIETRNTKSNQCGMGTYSVLKIFVDSQGSFPHTSTFSFNTRTILLHAKVSKCLCKRGLSLSQL